MMYGLVLKMNKYFMIFLRMVYVNFLWFLTCAMGLIVFTIGPATYASFAVMDKLMFTKDDVPIFKTFKHEFKTHFKHTLLLSWIILLVGHVMVIDFLFTDNSYLKAGLLFLLFFVLLMVTFIIPVLMNYQLHGVFRQLKAAVLVGFGSLHYSLVLYVVLVIMNVVIFKTVPGLLALVGSSLNFAIIDWFAKQIFARIDGQTETITKTGRNS